MQADRTPIEAVAPLRISFVGGGTDFPHWYDEHGGAVLSATIDHVVRVRLRPRADRRVSVRSLDLGHLVEYHLDEGPVDDGAMDLATAAIERLGVPGGVDVRDPERRAARQRPGRLLGARHGGGRGARAPRRPAVLPRGGGAPRVPDRARGPRHRRRMAGSVRRRVRRLQPPRLLRERRLGRAGADLARGARAPREPSPAVLHGPRAAQRRIDRPSDRDAPGRARGDAARHEAPPDDGLHDARRDRARRRRGPRRHVARGVPGEEADEPAHHRAHADRADARGRAGRRRVRAARSAAPAAAATC